MSEGVVPISNVKGFNQFNSITRATGNGKCIVKAEPACCQDIQQFMKRMGLIYRYEGIGTATLRAIEFLLAPKRETVGEQTEAQLLIKQAYQCAGLA